MIHGIQLQKVLLAKDLQTSCEMEERRGKKDTQKIAFVMPIVSAFDTDNIQLISYDVNAEDGII